MDNHEKSRSRLARFEQLPLISGDANSEAETPFGRILSSWGIARVAGWPDRFGEVLERSIPSKCNERIATLSLFAGAGGLDIGFRQTGFDIGVAVEIEEKFAATLKANASFGQRQSASEVLTTDIREFHPPAGMSFDFIIGGPPCQTFSAAGRRAGGVAGTSNEMGALFKEYVRLLDLVRPKGFLFENVYGITGASKGSAWKEIRSSFADIGYKVFSRILDAADYGVPQHRERLFIIGVQEGSYQFPRPIFGPDSPSGERLFTAHEAISGVPPPSDGDLLFVGGRYGHLLEDIPPGLNYSFYTEKMGHPNPIFSWRSKFSDFLYKADPDAPVRTIKAQGGLYTGPFHWDNRPFTLSELKRLQTFPDDYTLVGGRQGTIEQIGNSVPPQLARILALTIREQVFGVHSPVELQTVPEHVELGFRRRKRYRTKEYQEKAAKALANVQAQRLTSWAEERTYKGSLSGDFGWSESLSEEPGISVLVRTLADCWEFAVDSGDRSGPEFEIVISGRQECGWGIEPSRVLLRGASLSNVDFVSVWKSFEHELSIRRIKGDLVQLSGYYQYPPAFSASLSTRGEGNLPARWKVLQRIVAGAGVRQTSPLSAIANQWGMNESMALEVLQFLRALGYEVRNSNTNPQIASDHYLIPYVFPSLTPMSVQLKKRLTGAGPFSRDTAK